MKNVNIKKKINNQNNLKMIFTLKYFIAFEIFIKFLLLGNNGELMIARDSWRKNVRDLTCISEDDNAALIWNTNDINKQSNYNKAVFQPKTTASNECAIRNSTNCLAKWKDTGNWVKTNSAMRSMGPALDYRWEDFTEFVCKKKIINERYQWVGKVSEATGTTVFSARGIKDVHVLICENRNPLSGFCFWIIIAGYEGTRSIIRYCRDGAPSDRVAPAQGNCENAATAEHEANEIINNEEWKTFVLKLNKDERRIEIFRETYNYTEVRLVRANQLPWRPVSHIFIRCDQPARLRFHFYDYLFSNTPNAVLSSEDFFYNEQNLRVNLLVGLCPDCKLDIILIDVESGNVLKLLRIRGDINSRMYGTMAWESVKQLHLSNEMLSKRVSLKILTILAADKNVDDAAWAIDNLRTCLSQENPRKSTVTMKSGMNINCQKLTYSNSAKVDGLSKEIFGNTNDWQQIIRKMENQCGSTCVKSGLSICNSKACTCDRGFTGQRCKEECSGKTYGFHCSNSCECCDDQNCDKIDGSCEAGDRSGSRLPPFCDSDLEIPMVFNITDTSVTIRQIVEVDERIEAEVQVVIEEVGNRGGPKIIAILEKIDEPRMYEAVVSGLEKNTKYQAQATTIPKSKEQSAHPLSPYKYFITTCLGEPLYQLVPGYKNITVIRRDETPTCGSFSNDPVISQIYDPIAQRIVSTAREVPYTFGNLTSYKEYEITIFDLVPLFILGARTFESAPSKVLQLKIESTNATGVSLTWEPPYYKNGIIRNYTIVIELIELLGCKDTGQPTPFNDTKLKTVNATLVFFDDLHPYGNYEATVFANTVEPGREATKIFQTDETDIPTSVVSNLRINRTKNQVEWDVPANCTWITGSSKTTKLIFTGVNESVRSWSFTDQTQRLYYDLKKRNDLLPFTEYKVRAHVIRGWDKPENAELFREITWRTPPAAPPRVTKLQLYDADYDNKLVSLRWIAPYPPNGIIKFYRIDTIDKRNVMNPIKIDVENYDLNCELWKEYVCLKNLNVSQATDGYLDRIEVHAINKDVIQGGAVNVLQIRANIYEEEPNPPTNFTFTNRSNGIVKLGWNSPEISATKITLFYINIDLVSTELLANDTNKKWTAKCPFFSNENEYNVDLHLSPSTVYNVSVSSSNSLDLNSTEMEKVATRGSLGFDNTEKLNVKQVENVLEIKPLKFINATKSTTVSVIITGLTSCSDKNSKILLQPRMREWIAATYKVQDIKTEPFLVGANHHHGVDLNCSLYMGETYVVNLMINDLKSDSSANSTSSRITLITDESAGNSSLAWLVILLIIPICALIIFVRYRPRKKTPDPEGKILSSEDSTNPWNQLQESTPSLEESNHQLNDQNTPDLIPCNPGSCPVEIDDFEEYTKEALASGLLTEQYATFTRGLTKSCEYGRLAENTSKNRYKDLIAYDETRVVLDKISGAPCSDYINASYIPGYRNDKAYIATQGPKANTVNDFWRMIWQKEVQVICMLANVIEGGRKKCEQYWPEIGTKQEYGKILIWNIEHQVFVDYTFRRFVLNYKKEEREVTHLHYTGWPDHGVPMYTQSLVPYLKKMSETDTGHGPIVVHCSAGVGRTGTIILCDTCLRQAREEEAIDLPAVTIKMRQARANMVDNVQQYLLAHLVIVESMIVEQTTVPCNVLQEKIKELRQRLPWDVKRLNDTVWQDRALHALAAPKRPNPEELEGYGNAELTSNNGSESYSKPEVFHDPNSKYLTTVGIDGLKMKNQHIASRLLSPAKRPNFWKLIADENVELIIVLQRPDLEDPTCCEIMPSDESTFSPLPHIEIETKASFSDEEEHFTIDKLMLTDESGEEVRLQPVTVLTCNGWESGREGKPPPPAALVSLWRTSEKISRQASPTFVFCQDGVTGCGLYLALSFLLEHMAVELQCDVISSVRAVRRFNPEFVQSLEQFEYLYDAAIEYDKSFQTYANFS